MSRTGRTELLYSPLARAVTIAYFVVGISYLWWRVTATISFDAPLIAFPFLFADFLGFGFFALFALSLWARTRRYAPEPEDGLSVDVYITTYNESEDVLRPTIVGTLDMDYPHVTYVLDDGGRDAIRQLCEELGVRYLTRDSNEGAKAGNINAALPRTNGEFIAVFDADHVPFRSFLTELLGYFREPRVALAQAPQCYYNLDSFQHGRPDPARDSAWHEQSVFYDSIMAGKDRWNAAFWCGSSAILRRSALEEIGGVDTRTVTEDMHTAMSLHANGWQSIYHDRELALGIAPDDAEAFLGQRFRWAQGALQILRNDNPLVRRGLTWRQRIAYLTSVLYVIEYVPKAIYIATPIVALIVGALPMTNMGWGFVLRFVPYYLLGVLATRLLTNGTNPYFQAERFHLLKLTIMLRATVTLLWPRKLRFNVTAKSGEGDDHRLQSLALVRTQVMLGIASLTAVAWALVAHFSGATWQLSGIALVVTAGWALFNAGMVASLIAWILRRPHRRKLYRFPVQGTVRMDAAGATAIGSLRDISSVGIGWQSPVPVQEGSAVTVAFQAGDLLIRSRVTVTLNRPSERGFVLGGEFVDLPEASRRALVLFLYQQVAPLSLRGQSVHPAEHEVVPFHARPTAGPGPVEDAELRRSA